MIEMRRFTVKCVDCRFHKDRYFENNDYLSSSDNHVGYCKNYKTIMFDRVSWNCRHFILKEKDPNSPWEQDIK
jgi:hypothetical protein